MKIVETIEDMRAAVREFKSAGEAVGFVPTMGFLHEGHLSLVRASRAGADRTVVSIFVNPIQFGPGEDLGRYPRDLDRDRAMLEREGVDVLFHPSPEEIYPAGFKTTVEVHDLQDRLCGRSRPDHFRGVCTVVMKLFQIVRPDVAFFGQKDAQQAVIIRRMTRDMDLDVDLIVLPTVREPDGLALSSRNSYLSAEERRAALVLVQGLELARTRCEAGEKDAAKIAGAVRALIGREPLARIDYVEVVDPEELGPVGRIEGEALVALAVFIGTTRLIDNTVIRGKES
ncbi:MAG: pantoate--beta-alanine ligase [Candidatus Aminicenantes bacterium]|jgi:pantoate--beta-alanine ligase|nr:pantoate--beta-alanine ligase [Candidatus Aminicenantes bacterium]